MKLLTWNINSVRLRAPILLQQLVQQSEADIICLQETKTPDEHFPHEVFEAAGYQFRHINGMKSYNGVAILSRIPFENPHIHNRVGRNDCRHISVTINDVHLHNLYIPAGGDIPDRVQNEKFGHKLDFVNELTGAFPKLHKKSDRVIAVGDFNIAPLEHDVWSHKQLVGVVSHTPIEVETLNKFQNSIEFTDAVRHFVPDDQKCYSWWSYRNQDWRKSNRGRRLDHIWVTKPLVSGLNEYEILQNARDWEKASDHVPVVMNIEI
jgi:exodeoxyribonuclease-3